jgi:hypothetical protein
VSVCDPAVVRKGKLTAGGGRLSGVDVADDDDVDVSLLLTAVVVSSCSGGGGGGEAAQNVRAGGVNLPHDGGCM